VIERASTRRKTVFVEVRTGRKGRKNGKQEDDRKKRTEIREKGVLLIYKNVNANGGEGMLPSRTVERVSFLFEH